jgi:pimeloyl-ACP methyl ester carboxylesterase
VPGEERLMVTAAGESQAVWCAGRGPAVILVNGIGDEASSEQWSSVEGQLARRARVCRYDRPGTGASPAPRHARRGPAALTAELDAVVQASARGRVVLVAHSYGGYPARLYAAAHPRRVAGLVFVDALDPSVGTRRGTGSASWARVRMAHEGLDLASVEQAARAVSHLPGDPPVVVLSRGEDSTPSWRAGQARLTALSRRAIRRVVAESGHQMPTDAPDAIAKAVEDTLASAP